MPGLGKNGRDVMASILCAASLSSERVIAPVIPPSITPAYFMFRF
jgi:hypothetical protein